MCVRRRQANPRLTQKAFAPQTVNNVEVNHQNQQSPGLQGFGGVVLQGSTSNPPLRDHREKGNKLDIRQVLAAPIVGSGEYVRRRKDDDTLREVGNVMPEYDCDRDDPPPAKPVEKTQESVDVVGQPPKTS
ncbi:hypothetical protein ANCCAN_10375 [Ancylostoma caninum]|uniref:Uncharacterized protein n=1 Tax=Ancylostoma caninum TaxID=29170 RepID=A0A368GGU8_ANCCA|nr:hypothetical protein ANCCAN_10375 [Ancylostoma caninum]